jgi:CRISPR/Cas system-associated exonuclease Cas4 (RecB family)
MAFSNSSIKTYEECPYKYKLTRIEHRQEPTGTAAERGKMIHSEFEGALVNLNLVPAEHEFWQTYIGELVAKKTRSEVEFAVTRDWSMCGFKDSHAWLRGILDAIYFDGAKAHVLDWKTGKERDYGDQLKLYATVILACHPEVNEVTTEICYIDLQKRQAQPTYKRSQLAELKEWMSERMRKIENDSIFAPNPSSNCRWCHFRKDNGGPCQW